MLNAGLLAYLTFVHVQFAPRQQPAARALPPLTIATAAPSAPVSSPTAQTSVSAESEPFSWKQLYASDYHDYVRNLRAVGCPESTIRVIVAADVHAAYSVRAGEIKKELSGFANSPWTNQVARFQDEASLKDELREMPEAEAAETADLLGLKPAMAAIAPPPRRPSRPPIQPASAPLVFQSVDSSALNLTDEQKQAIAGIKEDFLKQVGGLNQDSTDSSNQVRWHSAQSAADDLLQATLGADAFAQYQVLAAQKSLESEAAQQ